MKKLVIVSLLGLSMGVSVACANVALQDSDIKSARNARD